MSKSNFSPMWLSGVALAVLGLSACTSPDYGLVQPPTTVPPSARTPTFERVTTGSLFNNHSFTSPFNGRAKPRNVGDALKVEISETMSASSNAVTSASRQNAMANKGPGKGSGAGILGWFYDIDAQASGSDSFKGDGKTSNSTNFTGQIAASVINVLPNGHLVVAGERTMSVNGDIKTLRFSGIVDPRDLRGQNVVASADVINARMEVAGRGDVSEAGQRTWLQRVLTNSLAIW